MLNSKIEMKGMLNKKTEEKRHKIGIGTNKSSIFVLRINFMEIRGMQGSPAYGKNQPFGYAETILEVPRRIFGV